MDPALCYSIIRFSVRWRYYFRLCAKPEPLMVFWVA
jgi:hypothetical protein